MPEITQVLTEADYDTALARISELLGAEPYSADDEELDRISTLVEVYEAEHYPMEDPDPYSLLDLLLDQRIVSREQLIPRVLGQTCIGICGKVMSHDRYSGGQSASGAGGVASMAQGKFTVRLSEEDRSQLEGLVRKGQRSARVINRARILLKTKEGWSASQAAAAPVSST